MTPPLLPAGLDPLSISLVIVALLFAGGILETCRRGRQWRMRREGALAARLSLRERIVLENALPWMGHLPKELRERLEGVVCVLLDEKTFEACGELEEVTEEMRLVIAAQAGLLVVNRPGELFDHVHTILVYPTAFTAPGGELLTPDVELVEMEERVGESSPLGSVVLAWDSVLRGGYNHEDGLNVVLHEFAHQLDQANGDADGAPILERASDYQSWARVFHAAYGRHVEESARDKAKVIDDYGAEDPAEFFAVATETFFERPHALSNEYPELFGELQKFYHLDPREWR